MEPSGSPPNLSCFAIFVHTVHCCPTMSYLQQCFDLPSDLSVTPCIYQLCSSSWFYTSHSYNYKVPSPLPLHFCVCLLLFFLCFWPSSISILGMSHKFLYLVVESLHSRKRSADSSLLIKRNWDTCACVRGSWHFEIELRKPTSSSQLKRGEE